MLYQDSGYIPLYSNKKAAMKFIITAFLSGDPGGIQTPDFQNRNLTFYSAELRGQFNL